MYFDPHNPCDIYNLLEAGIWIIIGIICAVMGAKTTGQKRTILWIMALFLTLFGGSDLAEVNTGAWWRPWWLLLWKGLCLLAFALCLWRLWQISKKKDV